MFLSRAFKSIFFVYNGGVKKAKVSLVKLTNYNREKLSEALRMGFSFLGGLENILKSRAKVFVKINHLSPPSPADRAIVTHPSFTREILRLLIEHDVNITVGDDIQARGEDGFLISGHRQVCDELGVPLVNLKEFGFKEIKCHGNVLKKAYISTLLLEADYIVNLPKLKTHSLTVLTGAVKNMYGATPYGLRLEYHNAYPSNEVFSQMLVDIFSCVPPHLTVMDGIVAMEGEGPSGGNPKTVGIILTSQDSVAVDAVASKIIGFKPMDIQTTQFAHERGFGTGRIEDIEISGETIREVKAHNFKHSAIAVGFMSRKIPSTLRAYLQGQLIFIPVVSSDKCTVCRECVDICPRRAVSLVQDTAWVDKNLCIHCMCCHEVCHFQAIKLKQKFWGKVLRGVMFLYNRINSLFSR